MWASGKPAGQIVEDKGLKQITDTGELEAIVDDVVAVEHGGRDLAGELAQRAGLASGDRVVAVDGFHLPNDSFTRRVARLPRDTPLETHALRGDRLLTLALTLDEPALDEARIFLDEDADNARIDRRARWLEAAS